MRYFNRNTFYLIIVLALVWVLLNENFSVLSAAVSMVISAGCVFFCYRFLPFPKMENINIFRLAVYPFFAIAQMYLAAFNAVKLILTGGDLWVVKVHTDLSSNLLRTILANSITLTPGSISLELKDGIITVLLLTEKKYGPLDKEKTIKSIKGSLEKILLKAEK